jgi:hypothetical protein
MPNSVPNFFALFTAQKSALGCLTALIQINPRLQTGIEKFDVSGLDLVDMQMDGCITALK